jgi:hypothetical protein
MLKEVVERDTTGFVKILLERAEKHLADLKVAHATAVDC